jgi:hypothetical protein
MYVRVLQDELQFPDDRAIDQDTKKFDTWSKESSFDSWKSSR